jgi:hypothetical protein
MIMSASSAFRPFCVAQGILRSFLEFCSAPMLARSLDLFAATDLVLCLSARLDNVISSSADIKGNSFRIGESNYTKDGILMRLSDIFQPVLVYTMKEMDRRSSRVGSVNDQADDVERLVKALQLSENHLLASRIIFNTWCLHPSKSGVI